MSYATIADADAVLFNSEWTALSTTDKQYALELGTKWIDSAYDCVVDVPVQQSIIDANVLLANKKATGSLYEQKEGIIVSKMSKADTVQTSKSYQNGTHESVDQFAEIHLLLGSACEFTGGFNVKTVRV